MAKRKRRSFTKSQIARYWMDYQIEHGTIPPWDRWGWDYGEPACMAGGYWQAKWDDAASPATRWNRSGLQKCHVVPLAKGGPDEVSNIVLMCETCHAQQPNSEDPQVTYDYMKSRTLLDCMSIGGITAKALIKFAGGQDLDAVTEEALREVRATWGV